LVKERAAGTVRPRSWRVSIVLVAAGAIVALHGSLVGLVLVTTLALLIAGAGEFRALLVALSVALGVGLPWPAPAFLAVLAYSAWRRVRRSGRPADQAGAVGTDRPASAPSAPSAPAGIPMLVAGRFLLACAGIGAVSGWVVTMLFSSHLAQEPLALTVVRPAFPVIGLVVGLAALTNSAGEELLWRWALYREAGPGPVRAAVPVLGQVVSFGIAHWAGIPGGVGGAALAGVYSAVVCAVRARGGLPAALLCHVTTDLVIFSTVARYAAFLPAG
jgi:hypothetical protein